MNTRNRPRERGAIAIVATLLLLLSSHAVVQRVNADAVTRSGVIWEGDFEEGDLRGFYWHQNAPQVVSAPEPVRAGNYAMRSYLHRYDSEYAYRTEAIVGSDQNAPPDTASEFTFTIGGEYWIGISIYVPADMVIDVEGLSDVVFQIQACPDPGEDWRSPVFGLDINADHWRIYSRWDTRSTSPTDNSFTGERVVYDEPLGSSMGRWTDWVFHVIWSYESDGLLQVWRDGSLVVDRTGPNCSNDQVGPHPAFGVYKWPWRDSGAEANTDWRLFYHDEFRIGDYRASYSDVAPGDGAPAPTPTSTAVPTPEPSETSTPQATLTPTALPTPEPLTVIVDDADPGFSANYTQDAWVTFEEIGAQHYGKAHAYNRLVGTGTDQATWEFTVPEPGAYDVYAWWWASENRPSDVPYVIDSAEGTKAVIVNQQEDGGQWNYLGTFEFEERGTVTVTDDASSGRNVVADAIKLALVESDPTVVITPEPTDTPWTPEPTDTPSTPAPHSEMIYLPVLVR